MPRAWRLRTALDLLLAPAGDPRRIAGPQREREALCELAAARERLKAKAEELRARLPRFEAMAQDCLRDGQEALARSWLQQRESTIDLLGGLEAQIDELGRQEQRLRLHVETAEIGRLLDTGPAPKIRGDMDAR